MNARQKAKHFKRLYEESQPKKPYPVVYQSTLPHHYSISHLLDPLDIIDAVHLQNNQQLLMSYVGNHILSDLKPLIERNLRIERDLYLGKLRYTLDIWLES